MPAYASLCQSGKPATLAQITANPVPSSDSILAKPGASGSRKQDSPSPRRQRPRPLSCDPARWCEGHECRVEEVEESTPDAADSRSRIRMPGGSKAEWREDSNRESLVRQRGGRMQTPRRFPRANGMVYGVGESRGQRPAGRHYTWCAATVCLHRIPGTRRSVTHLILRRAPRPAPLGTYSAAGRH